MGNLATLNGRFLALSGAGVTLNQNTITGPICAPPTLTTTASGPVTVGSTITDTAHLSSTSSVLLTGTMQFIDYAPGDVTCSTPIVVVPTVTVNGAGDYTSAPYTTTAAGSYRWRAFYSGDGHNPAVSTACGDAGETSTINKVTPTIRTLLSNGSVGVGDPVHDTARLIGAFGNAGGTVTYRVYTDTACTVFVGQGGIRTVTNGIVQDSLPITFTIVDRYYWQAEYSGDANNNGATSPCTDELLSVSAALTPIPPVLATATARAATLPGTGFAPQHVTVLSAQPAEKTYADLGDLWLEIPRLGVQMPIVGVPQTAGTWDVSWLGNQAGWLNGSAFPTWKGNSVITGHVWNADNTAGPFSTINTLWWGDKVIVHASGGQYVYEVRSVQQVSPANTAAMMKHEELPWVTLVTCRGYDQASNSYKSRVLVRAVLVEVK